MRDLNEIFKKHMTYYDIKSHKKLSLEERFLENNRGWWSQIDPPVFLGLNHLKLLYYLSSSTLLIQSIQEAFMLRKSVKSRGVDLITAAKSKSSKSHVAYYLTSRNFSVFFVTWKSLSYFKILKLSVISKNIAISKMLQVNKTT